MSPKQLSLLQDGHSPEACSDAENEPLILNGRKLYLAGRGTGSLKQGLLRGCPVFFWPMSEQHGKDIVQAAQYVSARVDELTRDTDLYLLAAFTVDDWNFELSPWKADIPEIGQSFGGCASLTLKWVLEEAFPYICGRYQGAGDMEESDPAGFPAYLAGYSLAGLFSLWAELETRERGIFAGAAGCSATMWFPGWMEHAQKATEKEDAAVSSGPESSAGCAAAGSDIYLSLGGKEHLTSNAFIASIGDAVRSYDRMLDSDPAVRRHVLEMNKGGHFSDPEKRVAKGIAWLLKACNKWKETDHHLRKTHRAERQCLLK